MKLILGYFQQAPERHALSVTVTFRDTPQGRALSIVGDYTRPRGEEGGGQMQDSLLQLFDALAVQLVPRATVKKLVEVWERWHLNDMRSACEHQRALGWTWTTHPEAECPTCGYKLGHAWLFEALPDEVVVWLEALGAQQVTL